MNEKTNTELIERYVAAVGRRLPARMRADVEAELRSTLLDALEAQSREREAPAEEALVVEILTEMGPPEALATQYTGNRALIGPRLLPTFWQVCRIVLVIVVASQILSLVVALTRSGGQDAGAAIVESLRWLPSSLFGALGMLVVIFALLERAMPETAGRAEKPWNPRQLPAAAGPDLVKPVGLMIEIALTVAAIVVVNFYRDWVGVAFVSDGTWQRYSILTPAFGRYLLAINLCWGLDIVHKLVLLRQGEWRAWSRWARVGLLAFNMAILGAMIGGEPIVQVPAALGQVPFMVDTNLGLDFVLALILVILGVEMVQQLVRLAGPRAGLVIPLTRDQGDGEAR